MKIKRNHGGVSLSMAVKRTAAFLLLAFLVVAAGARLMVSSLLPDTFYLVAGEDLKIASLPFVTVEKTEDEIEAASVTPGSSYHIELSLFGLLPVKTVRAEIVSRRQVQVCGTSFGIKMFSNGVMVVGFSDVLGEDGYQNPGKEAGLELGDYLLTVDGTKVRTNEQMAELVARSSGAPLEVVYTHDGKQKTTTIQPVRDVVTGGWRAGIWVRDSSAGIGTLTFVDPNLSVFAGLGHGITDVDTGENVSVGSGEIVAVEISGAVAGTPGLPGELKGSFSSMVPMGSIRINGDTGVYGIIYDTANQGTMMETAQQQEIEPGPAQILTTVDGNGVKAYDVEIEEISFNAADPNRNLLLHVTDPTLLEATGGIVQGMSGSPIIQNGRLIGAVTHVLVKDPTRGFGIFVENMLKTADEVVNADAAA